MNEDKSERSMDGDPLNARFLKLQKGDFCKGL